MAYNIHGWNRMNTTLSVVVFYTHCKTRFQESVQLN